MIKDSELRDFMDQVMVRGENLELSQIMQAIKLCADDFGIPIACEFDEVKSGGVLSGSTESCFIVYHPEHKKDYYNICVRLRKQGKIGFIMLNDFGKSRLENNQASHDFTSQAVKDAIFNGGDTAYAVGAVLGSAARKLVKGGANKTKLEEEQQYYTVLMGVFQEFPPYLDEIRNNNILDNRNNTYVAPVQSQPVVESNISVPVAEKAEETYVEPIKDVKEEIQEQIQEEGYEPVPESKSTVTLDELMAEMDLGQNNFGISVDENINMLDEQVDTVKEFNSPKEKNIPDNASKRCPKCNTIQLSGMYCSTCGSELVDSVGDKIAEENQPKVSINLEPHSEICKSTYTSEPYNTNVWSDSQDNPEKPNGLIFAVIGMIVVLIVVLVIVIFGMLSKNKLGMAENEEANKKSSTYFTDEPSTGSNTSNTTTVDTVATTESVPQIQIQYTGMEGTVQQLLDLNFDFIEFYQVGMLNYGDYVSSLNLYVVNDSRMSTWGQFKDYVKNLYAGKRATAMITTDNKYWGPDGDSGRLYIFPGNFSSSDYNITWDIYTIEITSQSSSSCSFKVVDVATGYSANGTAVYENGKWLLQSEVY